MVNSTWGLIILTREVTSGNRPLQKKSLRELVIPKSIITIHHNLWEWVNLKISRISKTGLLEYEVIHLRCEPFCEVIPLRSKGRHSGRAARSFWAAGIGLGLDVCGLNFSKIGLYLYGLSPVWAGNWSAGPGRPNADLCRNSKWLISKCPYFEWPKSGPMIANVVDF